MPKFKEADIELLLPTFREHVRSVLARMRVRGFKPVLIDGLRTPAQAKVNATKKTGIDNSMHIFGAAADIICEEHGWSCDERDKKTKKRLHECKFYPTLGAEVKADGSVWGGDWDGDAVADKHDTDLVHMQGLEATPVRQNEMRALGTDPSSLPARDALVKAYYKRRGR